MNTRQPSYKGGYARWASESRAPGLWKGLVGLWAPSLGNTGAKSMDVSGNGYDGAFVGGSSFVSSELGPALSLDGVDGYTNHGTPAKLLSLSAWSVSAWIKFDTASGTNTLCGWSAGTTPSIIVDISNLVLIYMNGSNYAYFNWNPVNLGDNTWHHFVATCPGSAQADIHGAAAYADGQALTFNSLADSQAQGTKSTFRIGTLGLGWYTGLVSQLAVYGHVLAASEIAFLYANPYALITQRDNTAMMAAAIGAPAGLGIPIAMYHYMHNLKAG